MVAPEIIEDSDDGKSSEAGVHSQKLTVERAQCLVGSRLDENKPLDLEEPVGCKWQLGPGGQERPASHPLEVLENILASSAVVMARILDEAKRVVLEVGEDIRGAVHDHWRLHGTEGFRRREVVLRNPMLVIQT